MYGVTAKVAEKIRMFLKHKDFYAGTGKQKASHHTGWSTAYDAATHRDLLHEGTSLLAITSRIPRSDLVMSIHIRDEHRSSPIGPL